MSDLRRMYHRIMQELFDCPGGLLCEIAFRCDGRFGTMLLYRAGCWFYGRGSEHFWILQRVRAALSGKA